MILAVTDLLFCAPVHSLWLAVTPAGRAVDAARQTSYLSPTQTPTPAMLAAGRKLSLWEQFILTHFLFLIIFFIQKENWMHWVHKQYLERIYFFVCFWTDRITLAHLKHQVHLYKTPVFEGENSHFIWFSIILCNLRVGNIVYLMTCPNFVCIESTYLKFLTFGVLKTTADS